MRGLLILASMVVAVAGGLAARTEAAPAAQQAPTLNLVAGQGDGVVKLHSFAPERVRVAVGTTVTWTIGSADEHTIAFLAGTSGSLARWIPQPEDPSRPRMANPRVWDAVPPQGPYDGSQLVNSGPLGRDQTFSVTFGEPGTYAYLCTLHRRQMTGDVEVVAPGTPGITTQAQADEDARAQVAREVEPQLAAIMATRNTAIHLAEPGGTDLWFVRAGTDARSDYLRPSHLDLDAFLPDALTVRQGDTVVWSVDHVVPHTVTFVAPGEPTPQTVGVMLPDGTLVTPGMAPPDPAVVPRLVQINLGPSRPSPTYDGKSYYSSGQIGNEPASPLGMNWALTFDTPGTYEYVCLLHAAQGMRGQITVTPR
jgi:plastocyanin